MENNTHSRRLYLHDIVFHSCCALIFGHCKVWQQRCVTNVWSITIAMLVRQPFAVAKLLVHVSMICTDTRYLLFNRVSMASANVFRLYCVAIEIKIWVRCSSIYRRKDPLTVFDLAVNVKSILYYWSACKFLKHLCNHVIGGSLPWSLASQTFLRRSESRRFVGLLFNSFSHTFWDLERLSCISRGLFSVAPRRWWRHSTKRNERLSWSLCCPQDGAYKTSEMPSKRPSSLQTLTKHSDSWPALPSRQTRWIIIQSGSM